MGCQMPAAQPRAQQVLPHQQPIHLCLTLQPRLPQRDQRRPRRCRRALHTVPRAPPPCRTLEPLSYLHHPSAHGVAQAQSWGPAVGRRAGSATGEGSAARPALGHHASCPELTRGHVTCLLARAAEERSSHTPHTIIRADRQAQKDRGRRRGGDRGGGSWMASLTQWT